MHFMNLVSRVMFEIVSTNVEGVTFTYDYLNVLSVFYRIKLLYMVIFVLHFIKLATQNFKIKTEFTQHSTKT